MIKIHPIFEKSSTCKLWTVKYDTEEKDVFHKLFDQWNDTGYLANFFTENRALLQDPFWKNITIDEAIDQVLEEAEAFEDELFDIKVSDENEQIEALVRYLNLCIKLYLK